MAEEQTLEVTIQNIVFQSDQGTFCVFRGEKREVRLRNRFFRKG